MSVLDEDTEEDEETGDEERIRALMPAGSRFSCCGDLCLSDSEESDGGGERNNQITLMEKSSIETSVLFDIEREHHLKVQGEIRSKLAALDTCYRNEIERTVSAIARLDKYFAARQEQDRRLDRQYQRKIAEALDQHLSAVQRDHEQRSQIVERRIRDERAVEEAKRREKALVEEKLQQEREKQEAEARQRAAAKAKADRQAAIAAAEEDRLKQAVSKVDQSDKCGEVVLSNTSGNTKIRQQLPGIKVLATNSALEAEARRLKLYNELPEMPHLTKEFEKYKRGIANSMNKLVPTVDSVRSRAKELIGAINGQEYHHSISCYLVANQIVSSVRSKNTKDKTFEVTAFACGYVILLVASQVPAVMDYVLAEFHKACIYTVPKHLDASSLTKDYKKAIGFHEEDGKLESTKDYYTYVVAYMKLYAAMVQTEHQGLTNRHGLAEGWKWLARFLNTLPPNTSTAFALGAFLKMAGFALHKRYGSQFKKMLDVISQSFLPALRAQGSGVVAEAVINLEHYLHDRMYLKEPEGRSLASSLVSSEFNG